MQTAAKKIDFVALIRHITLDMTHSRVASILFSLVFSDSLFFKTGSKLRTDFLAHLQLRGYAEATIKNYIQALSLLARHYNKSPLLLTPEDIITYLLHLRNIRKLAIRTYNIHFYSIKCFYEHFMPDQNMTGDLRRMKEPDYQPIVLSKKEVFAMIDAAPNFKPDFRSRSGGECEYI